MKTEKPVNPKRRRWLRNHTGQMLVLPLLIVGVGLSHCGLVRNYPLEFARRWAAATIKAMPDVKGYQRPQAAPTSREITPPVSLPLPAELMLPLQRIIPGGPYDDHSVMPLNRPAPPPPGRREEAAQPRPAN